MVPYFYNSTIRKYIIMFGKMFSDIDVVRYADGEPQQTLRIPIAYGPSEKWLTRLEEDPSLDKEVAIQLPRLAFELNSMTYDPTRALNKMTKSSSASRYSNTVSSQYTPVPYNFNITLSGMFAYQEDAVQVAEQIIPFFRPEWTMSLKLLDSINDYYDIPTVLNDMSIEDTYDGEFLNRRAIIYTWDFTVKGYLFGPTRNKGIIKRSVVGMSINDTDDPIGTEVGPNKKITITPTLGDGTPWEDIKEDDDWTHSFENEDFFDGKNRHNH